MQMSPALLRSGTGDEQMKTVLQLAGAMNTHRRALNTFPLQAHPCWEHIPACTPQTRLDSRSNFQGPDDIPITLYM